MNRLLAVVKAEVSKYKLKLILSVDERGLVVISGTASATVALTCQRCTEEFDIDIEVEFAFSPVKNEEAAENCRHIMTQLN